MVHVVVGVGLVVDAADGLAGAGGDLGGEIAEGSRLAERALLGFVGVAGVEGDDLEVEVFVLGGVGGALEPTTTGMVL